MKVDFYILETASTQQSHLFACQLLEKIYMEEKIPIFVHTHSREDAERFDALLWTYRDDSFLPHQLQSADEYAPIQIGYGQAPTSKPTLLLNLGKDIPAFFQQSNHAIEIVFDNPDVQQLARQRYKQYREAGCEMNTIKL